MPDNQDLLVKKRFRLGAIIFIIGFCSPVLIPLVTVVDLPLKWKAAISGALALGIPEIFTIIAIAIMGKPGFIHLKEIIAQIFKKYSPPEKVSLTRYRIGLLMFTIPLIMAWILPYIENLIPFYQANLITFSVGGDVLFISSLFVLGGEFWDKLRALFIYEARVKLHEKSSFLLLSLTIFLLLFQFNPSLMAGAENTPFLKDQNVIKPKVIGPEDKYGRGVPRSSFKGYIYAVNEKDFVRAAEYLDLRNLPKHVRNIEGDKLAKMFRDILNRALWVDVEMLSDHPDGYADDGLPSYRDLLGQIEANKRTYNLFLQKVPRGDGVFIWKISNKSIALIPELYKHLGFGAFGDALEPIFPDFEILGTKLWQWAGLIIILFGAYIAALIITGIILPIVRRNISPNQADLIIPFIRGPLRFLLWIMFAWSLEEIISPTVALRILMKGGTLILIAIAWFLIRLFDIYTAYLQQKFEKQGRSGVVVLLKPVRNLIRILIVITAFLVWLDNIGFQVTTLLAGLGIGGIAIALAAQAIFADIIGTIILLISQPIRVGDICKFENTFGIVEEIGVRATRLRTVDNTVVSVPNAELSKQLIENYTWREKVWFHPKISLPYETSKDQIRDIARGIEDMLRNHPEVLDEPIQVYFTEIGDYSHNIDVFSYVGTGDYGKYKKIAEELNFAIMDIVEKNGARLALPSRKIYVEEGNI